MQYVIQILTAPYEFDRTIYPVGYLIKSFQVNGAPIPINVPVGREQLILTNTVSFNGILKDFNQYKGLNLQYSYDPQAQTVSVSGATSNTWPID